MHQFLPEYNHLSEREAQLIRAVIVSVIPRIAFMIRTWEALLHLITVFEPHAIRRSSGARISESALELNDAAWVRFVRHHGAAAEAVDAMNSSGVMAPATGGNAALYGNGERRTVVGQGGLHGMTATGKSENGIIVGHGQSSGNQRPRYWADETAAPQDMGSQDRWAWCYAVNCHGVVAVEHRPSQLERGRAFRWSLVDGLRPIPRTKHRNRSPWTSRSPTT